MPAGNRTITPNLGALSLPKGFRLDAGSNTQGLKHISKKVKNRGRGRKIEEEAQDGNGDLQREDKSSEASLSSHDESDGEVQPAYKTRLVKKKKDGSSLQAPSVGRGAKETKRNKVTASQAADKEPQTSTVLDAEGTVPGKPALDGTGSQVELSVEMETEPAVQNSNTPDNPHPQNDQPPTRSPDGDDGQSASLNRKKPKKSKVTGLEANSVPEDSPARNTPMGNGEIPGTSSHDSGHLLERALDAQSEMFRITVEPRLSEKHGTGTFSVKRDYIGIFG